MPTIQIVFFFVIIGMMRVVQKICSKKVSNQIDGSTYFHYGGYYQLLSAVFSLIMLFVVGFHGFNGTMMLYAAGTAVFMAIELFTEIEALKGSSLIVGQMFMAGGLFIPCLFGNFFIEGQEMGVWQWIGLCVFMVAIYLMISQGKTKQEKEEEVAQEVKTKQKISLKTIIMLVLMMFAGGGTMVVQNAFGNLVENGNTAMYSFLMFAINALVLYICYLVQALFFKKPNQNENQTKEKTLKILPKTLLICGAFLALALFAINVLVTELTATVQPSLLFSLSNAIAIIVTMLVGRFVYNEKMTFRNVVGIALCAASLAIISFL